VGLLRDFRDRSGRRAAAVGALAPRPGWLTAGALRLLALCALIVAVNMVPLELTEGRAAVILFTGVGLVAAGIAVFVLATVRVSHRLPFAAAGGRQTAEAILLLVRRTGLPLLGTAFFLAWTVVYIGLWWVHPDPTGADNRDQAFTGLGEVPRFADFFYYAVCTAFISPPGDIFANSRGARAATMIEMLTGLGLVTTYAGSILDVGRRGADAEAPAMPIAPVDADA
jgi:hypothetical protein